MSGIQPIPLDWHQLEAAFKNATPDQLRDVAESVAPYVYANLNARIQGDVRDDRKIRVLDDGDDVTDASSGQVKYAGESYFDRINFIGGSLAVESSLVGRQVNVTMGAGADCLFDHLVSSCWATEVAAGRGTEGQTITTKSGCTYRIWSTLFGADQALDVSIDSGTDQIIFICAGHTESVAAATSLSAMADNQAIHVLGFGPYRPHINRAHAGAIFTLTGNAGTASVLRFQGLDFGAAVSTGRRPLLTATGGAVIPHLEFENVTFETASLDEYSHIVDMSGNGSGRFNNLIIRKCVSLEPGLLSIAKLATGGSATGYFQMDDCDFPALLTIMERTNSTDVDWGNLADSSTEPNGISITRSRLGIGTYALRRVLTPPLVVANNQIRFTGSVPCFAIGNGVGNFPKDVSITGNFFTCTTGGVTGAFVQVDAGTPPVSNITIMGNSLAGPGSGTAIDLADAQESTTDGYTVLNSYRDWTTNVSGTAAPGLTLPPATIIPAPAMTPEVIIAGDPGSLGAMLRLDGEDAADEVNIRWGRSAAWRAHIGLRKNTAFEAAQNLNDVQFGVVSGGGSTWTGGGTFHVPFALTNDGTAVRTYTANLQLGNGSDFQVYSDVYSTLKAQIDGATGNLNSVGYGRIGSLSDLTGATTAGDLTSIRHFIEDAEFNLAIVSSDPRIEFDTDIGTKSYFGYDRSGFHFQWVWYDTLLAAMGHTGSVGYLLQLGYARIGSASSHPNNITNGDLTAVRVFGGNTTAVATGLAGQFQAIGMPEGAAPGTPSADAIAIYNLTNSDQLRMIDDTGAINLLSHNHVVSAYYDWSATSDSTTIPCAIVGPLPHAGAFVNARAKTGENVTIGTTSWIGDVHLVAAASASAAGIGTTIFTTKPTIAENEVYDDSATFATTTFGAGDYLLFFTDQAGTNATFGNLAVTVRYT